MAEKTDEEKAKVLQSKYVEYQMIEQQVKQIHEQLQKFEQQIMEISQISAHLRDLKDMKVGSETLVPIANGVFVRGTITDTKRLVVNVGSGVAVDKSVEETILLLNAQAAEIETYKMQVAAQLQVMSQQGRELEKELERLVK